MEKIVIVSDSSCDLTKEEQEKLSLVVVPFMISFDGKTYLKDGVDITLDEFYKTLIDNPKYKPISSCPSIGVYYDTFEKYVKDNKKIICLCLTTKFSGSFNSANNAKEMILEQYKNAEIEVIDSEVITVTQGLYVKEIKRMIDDGLEYDNIINIAQKMKKSGEILFTIGDMDYLKRGGRIGRVALVLASKVQIKPIIYFSSGDITPKGITIGRKKSIIKLIDAIKKRFINEKQKIEDYIFTVGYGYDYEEGKMFWNLITAMLQEIDNKINVAINQIGSVIAVHTGPHPLGLGFIKKYNTV